jgi:hypothetical protein
VRQQRHVANPRMMPQASKRVAGGWSTAKLCANHRFLPPPRAAP